MKRSRFKRFLDELKVCTIFNDSKGLGITIDGHRRGIISPEIPIKENCVITATLLNAESSFAIVEVRGQKITFELFD